jgi:pimeloyl-ACP methyl ester carboxylesterase
MIVLVHGVPETADIWDDVREHLEPRPSIALRMPGFGCPRPDGFTATKDAYVDWLLGEIDAVGEPVDLVGHDWGGAVAWLTAMLHPERVERIAVLNAPHPLSFAAALRSPRQLLRSWYVFFFQLPWLPEYAGRARDHSWGRRALRDEPVRAGAFTADDVERHVEAWSRPGAATAAINYYRAAVRRSPLSGLARFRRVSCPVLVIWGEQDRHLGRGLASPPAGWVADVRVELLPDASHWVHCDRPERVNELLLEFLAQPRG